ncbi:MAG: LysR family transcriptional regulator [Pseudomonadota bacterium]
MIAQTQYRLAPADLDLVLALVRGRTLAEAARRLEVDASTVFRAVQRLEKKLGQQLFQRSRSGYLPSEQALTLSQHAERMEVELEQARSAIAQAEGQVTGLVRLTTTDTLLSDLLLPALATIGARHPGLEFELAATNTVANLSRREADLALRPSRQPPEHLVGKKLGGLRYAIYAAAPYLQHQPAGTPLDQHTWLAPDEFLPEHPSVRWRQKHLPKVRPRYRCNAILPLAQAVQAGLGVAVLPTYMARAFNGLVALTGPIEECDCDLWLLTHPESRHLRRVSVMFAELSQEIALS